MASKSVKAIRQITGHLPARFTKRTTMRTRMLVRHLSLDSPTNNNRQQKSLNWLIKPHRETVEASTGTIQMGTAESDEAVAEVEQNSKAARATVTTRAQPTAVPDFERPKKGTFYHEKIILGYSAEQMCELVGNVPKYKEFLPFCVNSEIIGEESSGPKTIKPVNLTLLKKSGGAPIRLGDQKSVTVAKPLVSERQQAPTKLVLPPSFKAKLEIGYPPIREAYTSHVSIIRPHMVKSISRDTRLFEFLINEWKFHPVDVEQLPAKANKESAVASAASVAADAANERACIVEFYVSFKFRSSIYNNFTSLIMDQIFSKMMNAFTNRALVLYGKPSREPKEISHTH